MKLGFTALLLFFAATSSAAEVAITIDDFALHDGPLMTAKQKDEAILETLQKNNVDVALFVMAGTLENPIAKERLEVWDHTNHMIANHTYSHIPYYKISFKEFSQDVWKAHQLLSGYKNFERLFRFPQLKEGDTKAKRDNMRSFLKTHGYKQGYVTIDASDWYISERLVNCLEKNPKADTKPFRDYYLNHLWDRAQYYDSLSQKVLGRSVKHTLLIHHNLLNALFLNDLIGMFRAKGWNVITAKEAFKDPVFKAEPNNLPAGESIIWALAKETGKFEGQLRYPGESEEYEKDKMDKLGL